MTTKIWRGDAPAVAQVTRVTPANIQIGDIYTLVINGKSISVTAAATTVSSVCTLLAAAIAAVTTTIPEFNEFTVTNETTSLLLTARTAGVPFVITGETTNGSSMAVSIETTVAGAAPSSATPMTQTFRIPQTATGTFTIVIGGQTTSGLTIGATAGAVETAVEALSTVGAGNCSVAKSTDANDHIYVMSFDGALAGSTVATAVVTVTSSQPIIRTTQAGSSTGVVQNEIQTVDTGNLTTGTASDAFCLTFNGQSTPSDNLFPTSTAGQMESQLEALSNLVSVAVTKSGQVFTIEFTTVDGSADQPQMSVTANAGYSATHSISVTTTPAGPAGSGTNEQQVITLTGVPTGGTFTLTFSGQTTSAIAYNASAATVDAALEALSNIGAGDVAVTGSAGGPWTVEFTGALAAANQPAMTGDGTSLTGGSAQSIAVDAVTDSAGPNHWDTAGNWLPSGVPANGDDVRFEIGNVPCLYGLAQSGVTLATLNIAMTYTGKIGLPRVNALGYLEYRTTELTIGATAILIGYGDGSGPSKVALNTGSVQTAIEVRDSGGSSESGIQAITWRGTHTSNALALYGGDVGLCPYSDQSANVATLIQRGGTLDAKHTAFITSVLFVSAKFYDCTLDGQPLESY